ncbi:iron-containing alcohol dehydrogenase family protein [Aeribacillus pallidus]
MIRLDLLEVRGAPNDYVCESGVIQHLEPFLKRYGFTKAFVICGQRSWNAVEPYFPKDRTLSYSFFRYHGECSLSEIERLSSHCIDYDVIIGIGGGKVLDLAKAVANQVRLDVVLIPTLASTCAAWTPLSVIYDDNGTYVRYDIFPKSATFVLVDPNMLLHSPVAYLRAGIADTLAKWYEADCIIRQLPCPPLSIKIAHQTAYLCKTTLLEHGPKAINDLLEKRDSFSFRQVIETNIMAGGMVGGFGDRYGRVAGAHSVHNGLTKVSSTHHLLHGEKVAYGILIQLVIENNWDEIHRLLPFYQALQLPFTFQQLGLPNEKEVLHTIAEAIVQPEESIHLMNVPINKETMVEAFYQLEEFASNYKNKERHAL